MLSLNDHGLDVDYGVQLYNIFRNVNHLEHFPTIWILKIEDCWKGFFKMYIVKNDLGSFSIFRLDP